MTGFHGSVGGMNIDAKVCRYFYHLQWKSWDPFSVALCEKFQEIKFQSNIVVFG